MTSYYFFSMLISKSFSVKLYLRFRYSILPLILHMYAKTDGSKLDSWETFHTCLHGRSGTVHGIC